MKNKDAFELREVWRSQVFHGYVAIVMSDQYGRFVGIARHAESHEEAGSGKASGRFEKAQAEALGFRDRANAHIRKVVQRLTS